MTTSLRNLLRLRLRMVLYGTTLGAMVRRWWMRLRQRAALHETSGYWNQQVERLYRRPNLNGRISGALRHSTTALLLHTCGASPKSVLDVGCAYGDLADALADIGVQRYIGVDLSDEGIETARREAKSRPAAARCGMEFHNADLRAFQPPEGERFDAIIFNEVLKYLDVDEAVREADRYAHRLNRGGVLCVNLTDDPKCHAIFRQLASRFEWVYGTVYQQRPDEPVFNLTPDRANPGYLVGLLKPIEHHEMRKAA